MPLCSAGTASVAARVAHYPRVLPLCVMVACQKYLTGDSICSPRHSISHHSCSTLQHLQHLNFACVGASLLLLKSCLHETTCIFQHPCSLYHHHFLRISGLAEPGRQLSVYEADSRTLHRHVTLPGMELYCICFGITSRVWLCLAPRAWGSSAGVRYPNAAGLWSYPISDSHKSAWPR